MACQLAWSSGFFITVQGLGNGDCLIKASFCQCACNCITSNAARSQKGRCHAGAINDSGFKTIFAGPAIQHKLSIFTKAMNDYKMGLNEDEIDAIFYECDPSAGTSFCPRHSLFEQFCCLVQV